MSIANYLVNLADGLNSNGVIGASKGGTGLTSPGLAGKALVSDGTLWTSQTVASGSPKVSAIGYTGDNTAANPAGGETITLTGTGFSAGARILINTTQVSVVTVVSATQITFTAPVLATGSYILYVVNTDGGTAILVPGIQYSGVPAWTTAAGTLGTLYETTAISASVAATSDSAVTYSLFSGTLPAGVTIASNGTISGTTPTVANPTTYTFVIRATDAELQDTDRSFSLTINPDIVTWSTPANNTTYSSNVGTAISTITLSSASAAGKAITYTTDALPTGISISGTSITGTPTATSSISTLLTATAATTNKTATRTIIWNILNPPTVAYLVVAGGGSGASKSMGGGGGGGGVLYNSSFAITTGTAYTVTVGGGGAASTLVDTGGAIGSNSVFGSITATGGGGGAANYGVQPTGGKNGGSGGGGGGNSGTGGTGIAGQGYAGGTGGATGNGYGAGGGGAGGVGGNATAGSGGNGGNGAFYSSFTSGGSPGGYYGGGGSGSAEFLNSTTVGNGGGGLSKYNGTAAPATANTGGGGGAGPGPTPAPGGAGGSGIVIIRYSDSRAAASTTGSPTVTVAGGYREYKFTSSGSITF